MTEGTLLFVRDPAGPIQRMAAAGGAVATPVTRLGANHAGHTYPHFLPDGRHFLYFVQGSSEARGVYLGQLDGPDGRRLFDSDSAAVYVAGHLLFVRQTTVYAYPFDDERLTLTGAAVRSGGWRARNDRGRWSERAVGRAEWHDRISSRCRAAAHPFVWVDRSRPRHSEGGRSRQRPLPIGSPQIWIKWPFFGAIQPEMPTSGSWKRGAGCLSRFTTHPAEDVFPVLVPRRPEHPVFVEPECRVGTLPETRDWRQRGIAAAGRTRTGVRI